MEENLQVVIRHTDELKESERREIDEVDHLAFMGEEDEIEWSPSEWYVLGKLAGRIVSHVGILKRRIRVGELFLEVGGVGGFATLPDYQQRGFGSTVLRRADEFMRLDLRLEFGLLVCGQDMIAFYSKHGWQITDAEMLFLSHGTKHVFHDTIMVIRLGERPWPEGTIDLCGAPW